MSIIQLRYMSLADIKKNLHEMPSRVLSGVTDRVQSDSDFWQSLQGCFQSMLFWYVALRCLLTNVYRCAEMPVDSQKLFKALIDHKGLYYPYVILYRLSWLNYSSRRSPTKGRWCAVNRWPKPWNRWGNSSICEQVCVSRLPWTNGAMGLRLRRWRASLLYIPSHVSSWEVSLVDSVCLICLICLICCVLFLFLFLFFLDV